jgi:serine/threonine-protein kinase
MNPIQAIAGLPWYLQAIVAVFAVVVLIFVFAKLIVPLFKGIGWVIAQVFRFVAGEVADLFRLIGALITLVFFVPITLGCVVIARWSAAAHFGRAIQAEMKTMGLAVYRMLIGHPARLLCLTHLVEGLEKRLPQAIAEAPGADTPSKRTGQFPGYRIVGSLPGGGSGSKLYVAVPDAEKLAVFRRSGQNAVDQVVIKAFSLKDGSTLPQIVREGRALDAAKRMGLVLEHELTNERFFYVTRYVPGQSLGAVVAQLHAASGENGLDDTGLAAAMCYVSDLLRTLDQYHRGGLWHKDVKPDNIIVDLTSPGLAGRGSAHLVDFGLVTPLKSAMTLTTHGTEYFRDPEMVRMALKGVKVAEVDGTKFDLYGAGAVLFAVLENSFPADGSQSQVSKRCPEALRWIIRRAMTDYSKRYPSSAAMLADLETVRLAADPFKVRPVDLPSVRAGLQADGGEAMGGMGGVGTMPPPIPPMPEPGFAAGQNVGAGAAAGAVGAATIGQKVGRAVDDVMRNVGFGPAVVGPAVVGPAVVGAGVAAGAAAAGAAVASAGGPRVKRTFKVTNWWTGAFEPVGAIPVAAPAAKSPAGPFVHVVAGVGPAAEAISTTDELRGFGAASPAVARSPRIPNNLTPRLRASEQLTRARGRAQQARERAQSRIEGRRRAIQHASGLNAGVFIAVFAFLGACVLVGGAMMFRSVRETPAVPSAPALPREVFAEAFDSRAFEKEIEAAVARAFDPAQGVVTLPVVPTPDEARFTQAVAEWDLQDTFDRAALRSGAVALVVDVTGPTTPEERALAEGAGLRLREAGFRVLGNYPGNDRADLPVASQIELIADLIKTVGGLPDTNVGRDRLREWLSRKPSGVEMVVWLRRPISPDGTTGEPVYFVTSRFVRPESDDRDAVEGDTEAAINALLTPMPDAIKLPDEPGAPEMPEIPAAPAAPAVPVRG